ncbi:hypothetical protein ElyMa_004004600 [Elysia marginata]|uniref:Fibronectin type-III domain-containing protein n=1 Tax=Elysia marginata TaxID=1093978 RepID=A0AAV4FZE9_9GAST|nr:hypothetical protein ElyMa_004004600 [Elysia marginata]
MSSQLWAKKSLVSLPERWALTVGYCCGSSNESTSGSGPGAVVCVSAWSPTSLEVRWSRDTRSSGSDLSQVKKWILTVAATRDRRRVVSFVTLRSSVSRHIVRALSPNTIYYVFLDSVDWNDWYVTMTSRPIPVRTLAIGESRTTAAVKTTTTTTTTTTSTTTKSTSTPPKHTEDPAGKGRFGEGSGNGSQRVTPSQTIPNKEEDTGEKNEMRSNGKNNVRKTETVSGNKQEAEVDYRGDSDRRANPKTTEEAGDEQRRRPNRERETTAADTTSTRKLEVDRGIDRRRQNGQQTTKATRTSVKTTHREEELSRRRRPNSGGDLGKEYRRQEERVDQRRREETVDQRRQEERVDQRRRVINRRTEAPHIPVRPTKPGIVLPSKNTARPLRPKTTALRSGRMDPFSSGFKPKNTTTVVSSEPTAASTIESIRQRDVNISEADSGSNGNQSEGRDKGDAGRRLLWWVLVTCGAGGGLFLALVMITVFTKHRKRSVKCPHLEQELSQTSRSSSKLNDVTSGTSRDNPNIPSINVNKPTNSRSYSAENGYIRAPSKSQRRPPLPPVSENAAKTSAYSMNSAERQREELSIYATVGDHLLTPDPARVVSIISWGSEFDILEEPKPGVYGNMSTAKSLDKVYGNLDLTYSNLTSATTMATSTQPQPQPPPPSSSSSIPAPTTAATTIPAQPDKLTSPHPYAVPRRQTSSSSVPNFLAPPPPPTSPTYAPQQSFSPSLQQQQQQQQLPTPLPGLDLPKEQLQQLVMLLLSTSSGDTNVDQLTPSSPSSPSATNAESTVQPTSPTYLVPKSPLSRKPQ